MIVVTGIGLVTPLGNGREKTWSALLDGKSAVARSENGLEARVFDFSPNGARSRMGDFAILAAAEALQDAGFDPADLRDKNIGCAVSQSKPLISSSWNVSIQDPLKPEGKWTLDRDIPGRRLDTSLLFSSFFGWSAGDVVIREFGLAGPATNVIAACATGVASIEAGARWIEQGLCDVALVGAAESSLNAFYRSGFQQLGVLTDDAPRPFDRNRSGFAMGEGAAVLVLESERSAAARGKKPIVRLLKTVLRQSESDALRFDPNGAAVAKLISLATNEHPLPGYINAHGTGTLFNDLAETRGIKQALGEQAFKTPVSSTKAATGHLLGAAGAVEAAIAALALRDRKIPPTLNLRTVDPECDLDYVASGARSADFSTALSLSYGFGGQMGAVLFG